MEARKPEDVRDVFERWEEIDGVVYDMSPPPSTAHQRVVTNLLAEFAVYLKGRACSVFTAPFGVWITGEEKPYVEPDIAVICDPARIQSKGCVGAPDLIVEVLNPAASLKDKTVKLRLYRRTGVREYWIADPANELLEVYRLAERAPQEPDVYGRGDTVSVGVFDDLEIDLDAIFTSA